MILNFEKSIYITFDIEWVSDDVLNYTLDIFENNDIAATFFATHQTKVLYRIRNNKNLELGIHPNYNSSISGQEAKPYQQVIEEMLYLVPEAVSQRAHCLTQNTVISLELARRGIKYDLNTYIPLEAGIEMKPFYTPSGMLAIPFFFEDDIDFFIKRKTTPAKEYFKAEGLKVFNFHPSHIFFNTNTQEQYEIYKKYAHDTERLIKLQNAEYGARNFLFDIIDFGKKNNYNFKTVKQIKMETSK